MKYYKEEKINNHYMKISIFDGDSKGADFYAIESSIFENKNDLKLVFIVYNEICKSKVAEEKNLIKDKNLMYEKLIESKKKLIRRKIRIRTLENEKLPPMLKNYLKINKRIPWE
ncbi:hypothetical protein ES702_02231 [subsurface metagenome]